MGMDSYSVDFPFLCPVYFCVGKWLKKSVPMSLSLSLASLPMNYDNKQRLLLLMEETTRGLHTAKLLGWIMFDPGKN